MPKLALLFSLGIMALVCGCTGESVSEKPARKKPPIIKKKVHWLVSHQEAIAQSKTSGKPIFAFFTGSDWCKYCSLLDYQIFCTDTFANWSKENVILLELDFPRETPLEPELKKQNDELAARYKVTGFPTVLILTAEGKPVLKAGYDSVPAEKWVTVLDIKMKEALGKLDSDSSGK